MDMFSPYIRKKLLTEIVIEVCQFPDMTELILEMADEDAKELYQHNENDTTYQATLLLERNEEGEYVDMFSPYVKEKPSCTTLH